MPNDLLPTDILIQQLAEKHLPAVMAIEASVHIQPWPDRDIERALSSPYKSWTAERLVNDQPVVLGYMIFQWLPHEATLMNIAVSDQWQGKGVARALLSFAIREAEQRRLDAIFLEVRASNQPAIRLYEGLGFVEIDRREGYYAYSAKQPKQREDAVVMSLPIVPT